MHRTRRKATGWQTGGRRPFTHPLSPRSRITVFGTIFGILPFRAPHKLWNCCVTRMRTFNFSTSIKESARRCWILYVCTPSVVTLLAIDGPLQMLRRGLVQSLLVGLQARTPGLGLLHALYDPCPALLAVLAARPGLAVLQYVSTLRALLIVSVLLQVRFVDT